MNILHVIPGLKQASGPTAFCVEVSDRLADDDTCVTILYGGEVDAICCMPRNPKVFLAKAWGDISREAGLDLVHIHSLWEPLSHAGAQWARRNRIPYVVSAHGMLSPWAMRHKRLKKRLAWWLYQKRDLQGAAMFHVTAECEIKWLRELGFKQPCVLAPLGSELPDLSNAETQRRKEVKTVLFVGRIYPVKGLMNLVRAWAQVKRNSKVLKCENAPVGGAEDGGQRAGDGKESSAAPLWQLVVAGPDQAGHKAELVAEAKQLGLSVADVSVKQLLRQPASLLFCQSATPPCLPDIAFTGPVYGDEKDSLYRLADLFVLPSFTENFGVVVTDALSYGVPVITTKGTPWVELEGIAEWQGSGMAGWQGGRVAGERDGGLAGWQGVRKMPREGSSTYPAKLATPANPAIAANGRCGWWVDIGVEPLANALQEAMGLRDEELRAMGENGRRLVKNRYTWPAIADQMKSAYEWLLTGGEKPDCVRVP